MLLARPDGQLLRYLHPGHHRLRGVLRFQHEGQLCIVELQPVGAGDAGENDDNERKENFAGNWERPASDPRPKLKQVSDFTHV